MERILFANWAWRDLSLTTAAELSWLRTRNRQRRGLGHGHEGSLAAAIEELADIQNGADIHYCNSPKLRYHNLDVLWNGVQY